LPDKKALPRAFITNGRRSLPGIISRLDGDDVGFAFVDLPTETRDFMIRLLYTSGIVYAAQAGELDDIAIGIARRFLDEAEERGTVDVSERRS